MPAKIPVPHIRFILPILMLLSLCHLKAAQKSEYLIKIPDVNQITKINVNSIAASLDLAESQLNRVVPGDKVITLKDWYIIHTDRNIRNELITLQVDGHIVAFQKNNVFKVQQTVPDDSLNAEQWYYHRVNAAAALSFYQPKADVLLAVIDTGIDYLHPDLQGTIWINPGEDVNNNGRLDAEDLNGRDDDSNGYVDDVHGWDFTDAPRYRDRGDYLDPDNDPMDDYYNGHGTQIAGIIAAQTNNQTGISGLVPGIHIMNLRAGTAQGYLEEDDVARAIVYAVENGAQIINMSFGDVVISPFLGDAVRYAYANGVSVIAAAGNSGTNEIHYPSGLAETISVGATRQEDILAEFSSWGPTIDLVAPGANIISTAINGKYTYVNGTSFSAPIISAAAAILLAENPDLEPDQIRNLLKTNCRDLGAKGWDVKYGAGLIDLAQVARNNAVSGILIHAPLTGSNTRNELQPVVVTVQEPDLKSAKLELGIGETPDAWQTVLADYRYQIISDTIATLDLSAFGDTTFSLRLAVNTWQNTTYEYRSIFYVDRTKPAVSDVVVKNLIKENRDAILIEFTTSETTTGTLYYRPRFTSQAFQSKNLTYATTSHRILLSAKEISGELELYFKVRDLAGHTIIANNEGLNYPVRIDNWVINDGPLQPASGQVPPGHALSQATDLDQDGWYEIVLSAYDDQGNYGPVQVYEYNGTAFEKVFESEYTAIPRSYGDSDNDGHMELLLGYGSTSRLLEVTDTNPLKFTEVRLDTGYWASQIADTDSDGKNELIMREGKTYHIWETTGNNSYAEVYTFVNSSQGTNALGPPTTQITDMDGDGFNEFIFGDYDGDVLIFENTGDNSFSLRDIVRLKNSDATNFFAYPATAAQEQPVLIAGSYRLSAINYEHEFDAQYWQYELISAEVNNLFGKVSDININGFSDLRLFDSGIAAGSLSNDDNDYVVLAPAPFIYLCRYNAGQLTPEWYSRDAQTNTVIIHDFDKDGINEFYYNNGSSISGYTLTGGTRPVPPSELTAIPIDTQSVRLTWNDLSADKIIIYRGSSSDNLGRLDSVSAATEYIDAGLQLNATYFYAVQTVNNSYPESESLLSQTASARPNFPPQVDSVVVIDQNQVQIFFNEILAMSSFLPGNFLLQPGKTAARSVVPSENRSACIVTLPEPLMADSTYYMHLSAINDTDFTALAVESQSVYFVYQELGDIPYIAHWQFNGNNKEILLSFNVAMDSSSIYNLSNYNVTPKGMIEHIKASDSEQKVVKIFLSKDTFTGSSGVHSYLELNNMYSKQGRRLNQGNKINLMQAVSSNDDIFVYPQPARVGQDWLTFANILPGSELDIFDIHGKKIISLQETTGTGGIRWNLKNELGEMVAAGIYLYYARSGTQTKLGKFAVVK